MFDIFLQSFAKLLHQSRSGQRSRQDMMALKPHQLLILLPTLLFVVNLPTCSSLYEFSSFRNLQIFRDARQEAYRGRSGGWRKMDAKCEYAKTVVEKASQQADVTATHIEHSFYKV